MFEEGHVKSMENKELLSRLKMDDGIHYYGCRKGNMHIMSSPRSIIPFHHADRMLR